MCAERWAAARRARPAPCANGLTISTGQLEHRLLDALRHRLLQPDLVEAFVAEYRAARESGRLAAALSRAKVERLTDMMADGIGNYAEMKSRLAAALAEREEIDRCLEDAEVTPTVALHPNLADAYRSNVERLTTR